MGFSSFQDIVLWLDVREATFPTGGTPSLNPTVPLIRGGLATWVRWRPAGSVSPPWDATFRVLLAAHTVVREARQAMWSYD